MAHFEPGTPVIIHAPYHPSIDGKRGIVKSCNRLGVNGHMTYSVKVGECDCSLSAHELEAPPAALEPAAETLARQIADAQKRATFKQIIYGADSPQYQDAALVVEALKSQQKREVGS